jgi:Tfp pilus assembly protein PilO
MRIASRDRLWLLGGLIVALLLVLVTWQFLIKGQNDTTSSVKDDIASMSLQELDATHTLNQLRADSANLPKYKAALAADQAALPSSPALPAFILELHTASAQTGVGIVQLQIGQPSALVGAKVTTSSIYVISINLVASGSIDNVTAFLKQLQTAQPRAVLLQSVSESPGSGAGSLIQLNTTFQAFVQPTDGAVPSTS